ncbi:hypothetical protein V8E55_012138 [Tylopilus felleus]
MKCKVNLADSGLLLNIGLSIHGPRLTYFCANIFGLISIDVFDSLIEAGYVPAVSAFFLGFWVSSLHSDEERWTEVQHITIPTSYTSMYAKFPLHYYLRIWERGSNL